MLLLLMELPMSMNIGYLEPLVDGDEGYFNIKFDTNFVYFWNTSEKHKQMKVQT